MPVRFLLNIKHHKYRRVYGKDIFIDRNVKKYKHPGFSYVPLSQILNCLNLIESSPSFHDFKEKNHAFLFMHQLWKHISSIPLSTSSTSLYSRSWGVGVVHVWCLLANCSLIIQLKYNLGSFSRSIYAESNYFPSWLPFFMFLLKPYFMAGNTFDTVSYPCRT